MIKNNQKIPEGWSVKKLKDVANVITGSTPPTSDLTNYGTEYLFVSPVDIKDNVKFINNTVTKLSFKGHSLGRVVSAGSPLFVCIGSTIGKIAIAGQTLTTNQQINSCIVNNQNDNEFLYYVLLFNANKIRQLAGEQAVPIINKSTFEKISFIFPPLPEQEKIAEILGTWDEAIEKLSSLIEQKKLLKKGLMQRLLTGKYRLKGFSSPWSEVRLGDILHENNERTIVQNQHTVLSVTKNGICSQSEYFDKQIASENNIGYKVLHKYNVVFSPMNLWMGSLGFSEYDVGIVSPAYKIFTINPQYGVFNFLKYFMICPKMINLYAVNSEMGASVVRRNLDLQSLLSSKIVIPDLAEQRAITEILSKADEEIELLNKKLEAFKQEKKALIQKLLTGQTRVKVN